MLALGRLGIHRAALQIAAFLHSKYSEETHYAALEALALIDAANVWEAVLSFITHTKEWIRRSAAAALQSSEAVDILVKRIKGEEADGWVREACLQSLVAIQGEKAIPILCSRLEYGTYGERTTCLSLLKQIGSEESLTILRQSLDLKYMRTHVAKQLAEAQVQSFIPELISLLWAHESESDRAELLDALIIYDQDLLKPYMNELIPALLRCLFSLSESERETAKSLLLRVQPDCQDIVWRTYLENEINTSVNA
ncbi:MAG: HEAT repeat domain-containing protein [Myxococcota bacterium]